MSTAPWLIKLQVNGGGVAFAAFNMGDSHSLLGRPHAP